MRHNEIYELDPVTDAVWLACADGLTVREIVARVARECELSTAAALAATVDALGRFAHLGLVSLDAESG